MKTLHRNHINKKKVAFYRLLRKLKRSPKAVQLSLFDDM